MTKQTNVFPKKRFEEFKHAQTWKQRTLGEVATIVGGGTPSTSNKEYWNGNINWYSPVEIGEQIYVHSSQKKITELGLQKSSAKILPVGTILFTSRAGIGNTAILAVEGATNQGFQSIVPHKNQLDPYFIYSRTNELKRYGEINGAGSTFVEVSGKQMAKMPILIPTLKEQRKIGLFFKYLDDLINLQQRKLEKTKALKAAYLSEMFPAEGELSPKRRFAGFTKDWEVKKLGELTGNFEYGLNASAISFDGINKYIRITDIDDQTRVFNQIALTSPDANLSNAENYILKKGDILFARTGASVGKTYRYRESDGKVYYAGFLIRARIDSQFDSEFVFQNTLTKQYNNFVRITSQRSGQPGINAQEYSQFNLMVPELDEQRKIGNFFTQLDDIINHHQRKLDKLQNLKKAYLHEMFV